MTKHPVLPHAAPPNPCVDPTAHASLSSHGSRARRAASMFHPCAACPPFILSALCSPGPQSLFHCPFRFGLRPTLLRHVCSAPSLLALSSCPWVVFLPCHCNRHCHCNRLRRYCDALELCVFAKLMYLRLSCLLHESSFVWPFNCGISSRADDVAILAKSGMLCLLRSS